MGKIDVWRPRLTIPKKLRERVEEMELPTYEKYKLRDHEGVDLIRLMGHDVLQADGFCPWHDDQHVDFNYSLLLILRNDTQSFVHSWLQPVVDPQPAGTMILLDIYHKHCLDHPENKNAPMGLWVALTKDLHEPMTRRQCEEYYRAVFSEIRRVM